MQSPNRTKSPAASIGICFSRQDKGVAGLGPAAYGRYVRSPRRDTNAVWPPENKFRILGSRERKHVELLGAGFSPITARAGIYGLERGDKRYELSNHLGNVLAVVSDRRAKASCSDTLVRGYWADIVSTTDYYPFGMGMVERGDDGRYRYGFNGQERDDEVAGAGNSYTAEFWQYDSRLGRRWNVDPVILSYLSPYSTFYLNPNVFFDPDGRDGIAFIDKAAPKQVGKRQIMGGTRKNPHKMTIMANYYFNEAVIAGIGGREALDNAIKTYNNSLFTVKGADGEFYQVEFKLSATSLNDVTDGDLKMCASEDNPGDAFDNLKSFGNLISVDSDDEVFGKISPDGIAQSTGSHINLLSTRLNRAIKGGANEELLLYNTFLHEIGHTLGGAHIDGGAMNPIYTESFEGGGIKSHDTFEMPTKMVTYENKLTLYNVIGIISTIWSGRNVKENGQGSKRVGEINNVD